MKISFSQKPIDKAPARFVRMRITEKSIYRTIIKGGTEALEIGAGKWDKVTRRKFIRLCRLIIQTAQQYRYTQLALEFNESLFPQLNKIPLPELASLIAQNFEMANYKFTTYKTQPKGGWGLVEEIVISGTISKDIQAGFKKGQEIGRMVNECRAIANTPGGDMTPTTLANEAKRLAKGTGVKVKILGKKEMQKLKMGGALGVAQGSSEEPKFIIMEYFGGKKNEKPIVLVGKGVTFDTGGINLKAGAGSLGMHMDMSGGAAVIASVALAAKLKQKQNVVALVAAVENMTSGSSYRPGDVLTSMSGKTIEVVDTDAEGRISLADSLHYARKYNPKLVVDVATLTGGALAALGQQASALFGNDVELLPKVIRWGEESGDYVWPLPLWEEYEDIIKGNRGDWANIGVVGNSRYGDAANAAAFLHQFIRPCPWIHLDIAPRMETIKSDNLAPGAAGEPVRLLTKLIEEF